MRDYELVYILDPDLPEEAVTEAMTRFQNLAESQGAVIQSQERWEKRRLAYEIKNKREGIYVVMELLATPSAVQEMDRILKITESVLRFIIVRLDEKAKADRFRRPPVEEAVVEAPAEPVPAEAAPAAEEAETTPAGDSEAEPVEPEPAGEETVEAPLESAPAEESGEPAAEPPAPAEDGEEA